MKKIVLFGDSITGGYINKENTDILERLTAKHLSNMGVPEHTLVNLGVNGNTSRNGLARVSEVLREDADIAVVFFGDNDAVDQKISVSEYKENLTRIIQQIGRKKVQLVSPSYIRVMDQEVLEDYVTAAGSAAGEDTAFLDLYHHMKVYPGRNEFLQYDGLHLSEAGYDFLAALIAGEIRNRRSEER